MRQLILLLGLCLMWVVPAQAAILYDVDFENGEPSIATGWTQNQTAGFIDNSTGAALTGTHSVKLTFDNINGSSQQPSSSVMFPTPLDTVYGRLAYKLTPGFQRGSNGITKIVRTQNDQYPKVWLVNRFGNYELLMENPWDAPSGSSIAMCASGIAVGTSFNEIEWQLTLNTPGVSNGVMIMWIDGVQRCSVTGRQFRGPNAGSTNWAGILVPSTAKWIQLQIFVQSGLGSAYIDRMAAGTTRVGLVGSAPTPDTTAPSPPTGVTVE